MTRRTLLKGTAASALLASTGLAATSCSSSSSTGGGGSVSRVTLPIYVETVGAVPAHTSAVSGGMSLYDVFPAKPPITHASPPLAGSTASALTYTFDPVAPAMDKNALWQEVNRQLGGQLDLQYTPSADYGARFATAIAGDTLPDLVAIKAPIPQLPGLLKAKFTDITEHVSGDAVLKYPNLAGLATGAWLRAEVNGSLWGVPIPRPPVGSVMLIRRDLADRLGVPAEPSTYEELVEVLKAMTSASERRWGVSDPLGLHEHIKLGYGLPGAWIENGGALTHEIETDEYADSLNDARALVEQGLVHPDGVTANNNQRNNWFTSGRVGLVWAGFVGWNKFITWGEEIDGFDLGGVLPISRDGTITPVSSRANAALHFTAITQTDPARVEQLLQLLDWLAAPFGSQEYLTKTYGLTPDTYTLDGTDPTYRGQGDTLRLAPFKYVADGPPVMYLPGHAKELKVWFDYQEKASSMVVPDPTSGLYSEADAAKGAQLTVALTDARTNVLVGRQPVTAWKNAVATWKSGGGDQIRADYQSALEQANG